MSSHLKIGLTYTGSPEKHQDYASWLEAGENITIIKLSAEDDNLHLVKEVQGIIMSGGIDVHPVNYNSSNIHYPHAPKNFNLQRDAFETNVFKLSMAHQLPVLGICRGMQLVNCILGGSLQQDLGPAANIIHRHEGTDKIHGLTIKNDTLLNEILAITHSETNSAHHQCINRIGNGLTVNAISDDHIIEGIEWENRENNPFFLGIQWHPERMYKLNMQASPLSIQIRNYFISKLMKA
jgi:putative glutamine amidotransferase